MVISFELKNIKEYREQCRNLKKAVREDKTVLSKIALWYLGQAMKTFREEGKRDEHPAWQLLSPMTLAIRRWKAQKLGYARKRGIGAYGEKILQDTGILRESIVPRVNEQAKEVQWGTNVPYAGLHQLGGTVDIPERTIVPIKAKALHFVIDGKNIFARKVHQPARTAKIPKREFLFFTGNDQIMFAQIYNRYLKEQLEKK